MSKQLTVAQFDYSRIGDDDLARQLECRVQSIWRCAKEATPHLLEMAEEVYEAHRELAGAGRDGLFSPWVESTGIIDRAEAYRMVRFVKARVEKRATLHTLEPTDIGRCDKTALDLLCHEDTPPEVIKAAVKAAKQGQPVTRKAVKQAIELITESRKSTAKEQPPSDTEASTEAAGTEEDGTGKGSAEARRKPRADEVDQSKDVEARRSVAGANPASANDSRTELTEEPLRQPLRNGKEEAGGNMPQGWRCPTCRVLRPSMCSSIGCPGCNPELFRRGDAEAPPAKDGPTDPSGNFLAYANSKQFMMCETLKEAREMAELYGGLVYVPHGSVELVVEAFTANVDRGSVLRAIYDACEPMWREAWAGWMEDEAPKPKRTSRKMQVAEVVEHYRTHHPRARPGKKEQEKIADRLRDGYPVEDLKTAIDGCHVSPFHCGENDRRTKYQSLELIMRDSGRVQQFLEIHETMARKSSSRRNGSARLQQVEAARQYLVRHGHEEARDWDADTDAHRIAEEYNKATQVERVG